MYKLFFKRPFDLIFSLLIIVLISPLFLLTALILSVYYRGNPFFTQSRPGLLGKPFNLIKFKSMINKYDVKNELLPDEQRITSVGKFIRKTAEVLI